MKLKYAISTSQTVFGAIGPGLQEGGAIPFPLCRKLLYELLLVFPTPGRQGAGQRSLCWKVIGDDMKRLVEENAFISVLVSSAVEKDDRRTPVAFLRIAERSFKDNGVVPVIEGNFFFNIICPLLTN